MKSEADARRESSSFIHDAVHIIIRLGNGKKEYIAKEQSRYCARWQTTYYESTASHRDTHSAISYGE